VMFNSNGPTGHVVSVSTMETIRVHAVTIDSFLAERGWESVSFVKLDIEGSELRALRGMNRLLTRADSPVVVFEANATTLSRVGCTPADLLNEFDELGYLLYQITPEYFVELTRITVPHDQRAKLNDYLAIRRPLSWSERRYWRGLPSRFRH